MTRGAAVSTCESGIASGTGDNCVAIFTAFYTDALADSLAPIRRRHSERSVPPFSLLRRSRAAGCEIRWDAQSKPACRTSRNPSSVWEVEARGFNPASVAGI